MQFSLDDQKLLWELDQLAVKNSERAAYMAADKVADAAPIYEGPPRASGRRPGTLARGIKVKKARKWFSVFIPHPGAFVELGGLVRTKSRNGKSKGEIVGQRAPRPFIRPVAVMMMDVYFKMFENKI